MASKHTLHHLPDDLDFLLYGIVSHESQYSVCNAIGDALHGRFVLSDYLQLNLKGSRRFTFSLFTWEDEALGLTYHLVPNLSNFEEPVPAEATQLSIEAESRARLVRELPKTDYLLIVKGAIAGIHQHDIATAIGASPAIINVQSIEPGSLASRSNLVF